MVAEVRGRAWRRLLRTGVALIVLLGLALDAEAQRGGKKKGGRGQRPAAEGLGGGAPAEPETKEFLPGFDTDPKDPKAGAASKAPAKPPTRPGQPKPPDPMTEAAAVTGLADHHARLTEAEDRLLAEHFRLCDLDENGWLSLREAESTLALDRAEYRRIDANQDGRLDAGEFARERRALFTRLGALPEAGPPDELREPPPGPEHALTPAEDGPPAPPPTAPVAAPFRSEIGAMTVKPGHFLRRYDADTSGGLSGTELEQALTESGLTLSAAQALEVLDRNDSGQLEGSELFPFAWLLSKAHPLPEPSSAEPPSEPASEAASEPEAAAPAEAVAAPGPGQGNHFARLDPGRDGYIDESDLRALQAPARLDLRLRAVLSALDRDGDGRLVEDEFRAAMGDVPR